MSSPLPQMLSRTQVILEVAALRSEVAALFDGDTRRDLNSVKWNRCEQRKRHTYIF